jgi:hypothetical protein
VCFDNLFSTYANYTCPLEYGITSDNGHDGNLVHPSQMIVNWVFLSNAFNFGKKDKNLGRVDYFFFFSFTSLRQHVKNFP